MFMVLWSQPFKLVRTESDILGTFLATEEFADAAKTIERRTDCLCAEAGRGRGDGW